MLPDGTESATQVDECRAIQEQRDHGGPAGRGAALDEREIRVPGKMTRPQLAARVEQGDETPCLRISGVRLGVFVTVARRARPGQFRRCARSGQEPHSVFAHAVDAAAWSAPGHDPGDRPNHRCVPLARHRRGVGALRWLRVRGLQHEGLKAVRLVEAESYVVGPSQPSSALRRDAAFAFGRSISLSSVACGACLITKSNSGDV